MSEPQQALSHRPPGPASGASPGQVAITATAPGKVILFGEHAINRGQSAIAAAVGLRARCALSQPNGTGLGIRFESGDRTSTTRREAVLELAREIETWRSSGNYEAIRDLKSADFFAPQKYMLACALGDRLPRSMEFTWTSEVPPSSGLGSGGSAFAAMATALAGWMNSPANDASNLENKPPVRDTPSEPRADWAHRGDIVAHGGIASALDTLTSLCGGVIRLDGRGPATPIPVRAGLTLVIAHSGVSAPTSEVNSRVRRWLDEEPRGRMRYFESMGILARAAERAIEEGDWEALGNLMTLNQLALEKIGVSCPECDRLVAAALGAGAFGAKISGSGGGGIVLALVSASTKPAVARAFKAAGGEVFMPGIGVPGASISTDGPFENRIGQS